MKINALPSQDRLREILDYDPVTGSLTWSQNHPTNPYKGKPAGYSHPKKGRPKVKIDQKHYHTGRIVWMWFYGEDPGDKYVDHIDRDTTNNALDNLRLATTAQNAANAIHPGYTYRPKLNKYCSTITKDGKQTVIGYFNTKEEAVKAYREEHVKLHGTYSPYYNQMKRGKSNE